MRKLFGVIDTFIYLDCSDGFTGIHLWQNSSIMHCNMCSVLFVNYISIKLLQKINIRLQPNWSWTYPSVRMLNYISSSYLVSTEESRRMKFSFFKLKNCEGVICSKNKTNEQKTPFDLLCGPKGNMWRYYEM